jgi:hypothetical protein
VGVSYESAGVFIAIDTIIGNSDSIVDSNVLDMSGAILSRPCHYHDMIMT